jgi:hypothetical protein
VYRPSGIVDDLKLKGFGVCPPAINRGRTKRMGERVCRASDLTLTILKAANGSSYAARAINLKIKRARHSSNPLGRPPAQVRLPRGSRFIDPADDGRRRRVEE